MAVVATRHFLRTISQPFDQSADGISLWGIKDVEARQAKEKAKAKLLDAEDEPGRKAREMGLTLKRKADEAELEEMERETSRREKSKSGAEEGDGDEFDAAFAGIDDVSIRLSLRQAVASLTDISITHLQADVIAMEMPLEEPPLEPPVEMPVA